MEGKMSDATSPAQSSEDDGLSYAAAGAVANIARIIGALEKKEIREVCLWLKTFTNQEETDDRLFWRDAVASFEEYLAENAPEDNNSEAHVAETDGSEAEEEVEVAAVQQMGALSLGESRSLRPSKLTRSPSTDHGLGQRAGSDKERRKRKRTKPSSAQNNSDEKGEDEEVEEEENREKEGARPGKKPRMGSSDREGDAEGRQQGRSSRQPHSRSITPHSGPKASWLPLERDYPWARKVYAAIHTCQAITAERRQNPQEVIAAAERLYGDHLFLSFRENLVDNLCALWSNQESGLTSHIPDDSLERGNLAVVPNVPELVDQYIKSATENIALEKDRSWGSIPEQYRAYQEITLSQRIYEDYKSKHTATQTWVNWIIEASGTENPPPTTAPKKRVDLALDIAVAPSWKNGHVNTVSQRRSNSMTMVNMLNHFGGPAALLLFPKGCPLLKEIRRGLTSPRIEALENAMNEEVAWLRDLVRILDEHVWTAVVNGKFGREPQPMWDHNPLINALDLGGFAKLSKKITAKWSQVHADYQIEAGYGDQDSQSVSVEAGYGDQDSQSVSVEAGYGDQDSQSASVDAGAGGQDMESAIQVASDDEMMGGLEEMDAGDAQQRDFAKLFEPYYLKGDAAMDFGQDAYQPELYSPSQ